MNKLFFLLLVSAAVVFGEVTTDSKAIKAVQDCQKDPHTKVSTATLDKVTTGTYPDDPQMAKMMMCFMKKMDFMKEDGTLDEATIKTAWGKIYTPEQMTKLTACIVKKEKPETTAMDMFKCKQTIVGLNSKIMEAAKAAA